MMMRFMGESVTEEEIEVRDKKNKVVAYTVTKIPYMYFQKRNRAWPPSQRPWYFHQNPFTAKCN